jgi:predicted transcriptional regulator
MYVVVVGGFAVGVSVAVVELADQKGLAILKVIIHTYMCMPSDK